MSVAAGAAAARWTKERANAWYEEQPWLVGCNFIPSTAINQLEMWQEQTFDPETIDRELGWAADLGFNTVRVYLHDLLWEADEAGFGDRIEHYLRIADAHGLRTLFVLFDDCWNDEPKLGEQPAPRPGVHNSGWAQSPGSWAVADRRQWPRLEAYVRGVVEAFGSDERVLMWDVYNEVANRFITDFAAPAYRRVPSHARTYVRHVLMKSPSLDLLEAAFDWARSVGPEQPLTSAVYLPFARRLNRYLVAASDVISFHNYENYLNLRDQIQELKAHGRPVICTEWLSRPVSRVETHLPLFRWENVGCYNWGLVKGKTQTIYSWKSVEGADEPDEWFHDLLRPDGTPFDAEEVEFIRRLTAGAYA